LRDRDDKVGQNKFHQDCIRYTNHDVGEGTGEDKDADTSGNLYLFVSKGVGQKAHGDPLKQTRSNE